MEEPSFFCRILHPFNWTCNFKNKKRDEWIWHLIVWGTRFIDHQLLALKANFQMIVLFLVLHGCDSGSSCRGKVVIWYSGDASFKSLPGPQLLWLWVFIGFCCIYKWILRLLSRVDHDRFLQNLSNSASMNNPNILRCKSWVSWSVIK